MTKAQNTASNLLLMIVTLPGTVYYTVPMIQSIWNMLVYPTYKVLLPSGVVLFCFIVFAIEKIGLAKDKTDTDFKTTSSSVVGFWLSIAVMWCIAKIYTFLI